MALAVAISSGACAVHGQGDLDRRDRGAGQRPQAAGLRSPIPLARLAIMPVAGDAPQALAEVLAASVAESLALLAPGVELVGPDTAADLLASRDARTARDSAFTYESGSARADHLSVDRITAAVGTPWIVDLRIDPMEMPGPRRGARESDRAGVPDALGARVTLWSAGDGEPAWGGVVVIPEAVARGDHGSAAAGTLRTMIRRLVSRAPIVAAR